MFIMLDALLNVYFFFSFCCISHHNVYCKVSNFANKEIKVALVLKEIVNQLIFFSRTFNDKSLPTTI